MTELPGERRAPLRDRSAVKTVADKVLQHFFGDIGFIGADVEAKENYLGEDSLSVTLHFEAGADLAAGA